MTDISVKLSIQIPGGPSIQTARTIAVDAYEKIDVALPPGATASIDVLLLKDKAKLLLIESSLYSEKTDKQIVWSLGSITKKPLDELQLFLGSASMDVFGLTDEKATITFTNSYPATEKVEGKDKDLTKQNTALIDILVGRSKN